MSRVKNKIRKCTLNLVCFDYISKRIFISLCMVGLDIWISPVLDY